MGTSYTDYGPHGFWARDSIVEAWLLVLVIVVDASPTQDAWLREAREGWLLHAVAGFQGCVEVSLDRHLDGDPDREAAFRALVAAVGARLDRYGPAAVPPEVAAQLGIADEPDRSILVADQLRRFTVAIAGLLRGEITWDTSGRVPGVWPAPATDTGGQADPAEHRRPARSVGIEDPPADTPQPGMIISVLTREDVIVMDPQRFLAAARRAYRAQDPAASDVEAAAAVTDVYDAVDALINQYGRLGSEHPDVAAGASPLRRMHGGLGLRPGDRVPDRPDGLSPAGAISLILLDEPLPLQDYGCFLPETADLFTEPARRATST